MVKSYFRFSPVNSDEAIWAKANGDASPYLIDLFPIANLPPFMLLFHTALSVLRGLSRSSLKVDLSLSINIYMTTYLSEAEFQMETAALVMLALHYQDIPISNEQ